MTRITGGKVFHSILQGVTGQRCVHQNSRLTEASVQPTSITLVCPSGLLLNLLEMVINSVNKMVN